MTKKQLIEQEIVKVEKELERLKLLLHSVSGSALEICPNCETKNYHYYPKTNNMCCAFC